MLRWGSWIYLGLAIAAILWLGLREGAIPVALFFARDAWPVDLAAGAGAAAAIVGIWQLGLRFLPSAHELEKAIRETIGPLNISEIITLAILSGFSEELFFRGAVQGQWGIVPATALFAVLHMGPGREFRLWTVFAVIAGVVLGALMIWRGNLLAPAVAHVSVNLVGLLRMQKPISGSPQNPL
jgi:membrane protease YdiL (CAAX protease family)